MRLEDLETQNLRKVTYQFVKIKEEHSFSSSNQYKPLRIINQLVNGVSTLHIFWVDIYAHRPSHFFPATVIAIFLLIDETCQVWLFIRNRFSFILFGFRKPGRVLRFEQFNIIWGFFRYGWSCLSHEILEKVDTSIFFWLSNFFIWEVDFIKLWTTLCHKY